MHNTFIQRRRHIGGLRNAGRTALCAVALIASALHAGAQNYPNGLSADSVDPAGDAAFIKAVNARMDSIRATQKRPTVALVLSGGGAKGAAEVGALKYLEEQKIPVDFVCGTSIGGLLGGLYSIGYNSNDLRNLFTTQDWSYTLTDKVDPKFIPYTTKMYKETYLVNIPFHYDDEDYAAHTHQNPVSKHGRVKVNLSSDNEVEFNSQMGVNTLASSLPSGYAYGFNINNLLNSLTVGYQDSLSFDKLPTPYLCVASDLISLKAKNWTSGYLETAMRSTMSIPGLFDPVRTNNMILVDGGTRNNYPSDIARAIGADYIIGIELSDENPGYSQVNHLGNIVGQFIKMLGKDAFDKNVIYPDVHVKPTLREFNMLSFTPTAVDTMINRGYKAIQEQDALIQEVKDAVGEHERVVERPAVDINKTAVLVRSIHFEGVNDDESKMLFKAVGLRAGQFVYKDLMDEAMSTIQATGAFETVTYSLYGEESPYDLVFHCQKGPSHQLGIGLRLDSEEWAAVLLNVGLNARHLMGSKFDFTARVGRMQKVSAKYSLVTPYLPTVNVEANFRHAAYDLFSKGDINANKETWEHYTHATKVYLSNIKWTAFNLEIGAQYKFFSMNTKRAVCQEMYRLYPDYAEALYFSGFVNGSLYTFDDKYYPTKGASVNFLFDADFAKAGMPDFKPFYNASIDVKFVLPFGEQFALIPDLHWRSCLNNEGETSYFHRNFVGGDVAGRYFDQQIPFIGLNSPTAMRSHVFVANMDLRYRAARNLYVSALAGYVNDGEDIHNLYEDFTPTCFGFAGQVAYNSILGPIEFAVRWSDVAKWKLYFSIGFDF